MAWPEGILEAPPIVSGSFEMHDILDECFRAMLLVIYVLLSIFVKHFMNDFTVVIQTGPTTDRYKHLHIPRQQSCHANCYGFHFIRVVTGFTVNFRRGWGKIVKKWPTVWFPIVWLSCDWGSFKQLEDALLVNCKLFTTITQECYSVSNQDDCLFNSLLGPT